MNAAIRYDPLNWQAESITQAQTEIKEIVKNGVLYGMPFLSVNALISRAIKRALSKIRSPSLRLDTQRSLTEFANQISLRLSQKINGDRTFLLSILLLTTSNVTRHQLINAERIVSQNESFRRYTDYSSDAKGIPMQIYAKEYIDKFVRPALDELAKAEARDPNAETKRSSLRNLAEMQVRHEAQEQEIADFKSAGVRLVVCSVHVDCSDRCAPWQGRVYSLDGTSGITEDGRRFVPLEEATDIFYTTKKGKRYKNGLLGFNCRHRLYSYKPEMVIPSVSKSEQRKEYEITKLQRKYERKIREARDRAIVYKDTLPEIASEWSKRAAILNRKYIEFSKENNRAYYPSRTKNL